jgi:hypothetical protein
VLVVIACESCAVLLPMHCLLAVAYWQEVYREEDKYVGCCVTGGFPMPLQIMAA